MNDLIFIRCRYRGKNKSLPVNEVSEHQLSRDIQRGYEYFWSKRPTLQKPEPVTLDFYNPKFSRHHAA